MRHGEGAYAIADRRLEIDLYTSRDVLELISVIDFTEIDIQLDVEGTRE